MRRPHIYLAGPINDRNDADCKGWRAQARVALQGVCEIHDPMERDYRGAEMEPGISTLIVENDKADIRACDALLAYFDGPSVGTAMEVFYAWTLGIPVHVANASGKPLSPWLIYHASLVHADLGAACLRLAGQP